MEGNGGRIKMRLLFPLPFMKKVGKILYQEGIIMEKSELCIDIATVSCMEKLKVESEWTMLETRGVTLKNQKHRFQPKAVLF